MRGGHPARAGLSKLNSMPATGVAPQESSAIVGIAAGAVAELNSMPGFGGHTPQEWRAADGNPVRFGRRARPDGRSNGPGWAGGSAGAPYGAP